MRLIALIAVMLLAIFTCFCLLYVIATNIEIVDIEIEPGEDEDEEENEKEINN